MNEGHENRIALNEATYRKVNEGVRAEDPAGTIAFLCECGRLGCNQLIRLTRAEYEAVRANPRRFAILDGHEIPEVEDIVDRAEGFVVVEKRGKPEAEIVEHTDPRQPLDD
jgi:predicted ThiF/HesA family dinucleotide-utilizing enzyme